MVTCSSDADCSGQSCNSGVVSKCNSKNQCQCLLKSTCSVDTDCSNHCISGYTATCSNGYCQCHAHKGTMQIYTPLPLGGTMFIPLHFFLILYFYWKGWYNIYFYWITIKKWFKSLNFFSFFFFKWILHISTYQSFIFADLHCNIVTSSKEELKHYQ